MPGRKLPVPADDLTPPPAPANDGRAPSLLDPKAANLPGKLIVVEGADGSGRSTQIALLTEWLESAGFAVKTMGLRRSNLLAKDIDDLLAKNAVTQLTLALMYATDFYDQLENSIIPAMSAGLVVLADRYVYTLMTRSVVRGLDRKYLEGIYKLAPKPDLTVRLHVRPEVAFEREFRKSPVISFWESGRDMSLSSDLYSSFIRYQTLINAEFARLAKAHEFIPVDGEAGVRQVNLQLRRRVARLLGIRSTRYKPSALLAGSWR
ncbi:thymidylate kinase [bacterium]|nr:thymidylate kinase [bacterium]